MTAWRLQLRKRNLSTYGKNFTLFARISPEVVRTFSNHLSTLDHSQTAPPTVSGFNTLDHLESEDNTTFLPLEISFSDNSKIYVSYNGGSIDETDAIELPSSVLSKNCADDFVSVSIVLFVPDARELTVEPVSTEDWELFEIYSSYFENGALLKQVSLVYPGQILSLSLGDGYDFARVRVDPQLKGCHRLRKDTHFVVVPKPRPKEAAPSECLFLVGTTEDWSDSMHDLANQLQIKVLSVNPRSMLIHPATLATVPGYTDEMSWAVIWRDDIDVSEQTMSLVMIETTSEIEQGCVATCAKSRLSINATPLIHHVRIQLISNRMISRGLDWTKELIDHGEIEIFLEKLEPVMEEDKVDKPWRDCEYWCNRFCPNSISMFNRPDTGKMLATDGSIVVHPRCGSLYKVRIRDQHESCGGGEYSPVPRAIFRLQEIQDSTVFGSRCKSIQKYEMQLSLMSPTTHVVRDYNYAVIDGMKAGREAYDAWIVEGDSGSGKTHLCLLLAAAARMKWALPTFYLDCKKLQAGHDLKMQTLLDELTFAFTEAFGCKPSLLILDNLECVVPNLHNDSHNNSVELDQAKLIANHIQSLMEACNSKVTLVISCQALSKIYFELTETITTYKSLTIGVLNARERSHLLCMMMRNNSEVSFERLSSLTEGYRAQDLRNLVTRADESIMRNQGCIEQTFADVIDDYVPLSRQGLKSSSEASESQVWSDVGGLFDAKRILKRTILDPVKYRRIYDTAPIHLPNGIFLFGPPGCGKSFLVPALARECGITSVITCRGPELLDRYIGASEANVRKLFEQARCSAPSILFLDEFDALAPRRGTDHTGVTDRVVNQLLTFLDGVESTLKGVFIIAATSRPDKVDPALLRPGRLEQHIYIGFPKSLVERHDIIEKISSKRKIANEFEQAIKLKSFCSSVEEADHLKVLSAADIRAALDTAQIAAIHDHIKEGYDDENNVFIRLHHFRKALLQTRPSLSSQDCTFFDTINRQFLTHTQPYNKTASATHVEQKTTLK